LGSTGNGAKAGVIAGIVYGVILGITSYFTVVALKDTVIAAIAQNLPSNSPFTADQLYGIVVLLTPGIAAIGGIIGGIIVGAAYGWAYHRIPGRTPVVKALVVSLVLWLLVSVLARLGDLRYGASYYLTGIGEGLFGVLVFGLILGWFYGRFSRPAGSDITRQGA
jgi:hypothetical protein